METKKINRLLLGIFVLHIVVVVVLTMTADIFNLPIVLNLSLGELIIMVPSVIYLAGWKMCSGRTENGKRKEFRQDTNLINAQAYEYRQDLELVKPQELDSEDDFFRREFTSKKETLKERLHFNKVKPSTFAYVLIFTWLSMPLTTLINAISMLFVDNTILSMSDIMLELPFIVMLFLMAVMPAFCEELAFRGIVYGGYRKEGWKFQAVLLSGFMFGIMHMNLNQALYAFVIGVLLALLFEATNSIFTTMMFHFIYNAQSCCMMYLLEEIMPGYYSEAANLTASPEELYMMISVYLVMAAIFTPLAFCMLYKIAKNENRVEQLKETLPVSMTRKQKQEKAADEWTSTEIGQDSQKGAAQGKVRLVTISYVLATVIAAVYIIFDIVISKMY